MKMRRLIKLVRVMQALPDNVMDRNPFMNVPDCSPFLGLVSIVAEKIPALKRRYKYDEYDDSKWEQALTDYLGDDLASWAGRNSELWGNEMGYSIYATGTLFYIAFNSSPVRFFANYHIVYQLIRTIHAWNLLTFREKISLNL